MISLLPLAGVQPHGRGVQEGVFTFRSYGIEDGLANLSVYTIAQDSEGFLWVGTDDGLYRYDGHRFSSWRIGLKSSLVWDIATGPGGAVWANTDDGIYRLEGAGFVPVEGLPGVRAGFVALGPGDGAFAGQGSYIYHRSGRGPMERLATLSGPVTAGWASKDLGTLLATTETRLHRLERGAWSDLPLPRGFQGTSARLFRDHAGRIFLRSRSDLWRMDAWGGAWVNLTSGLPGNAFNASPPVEDFLGRIWVGTSKGLACFDGAGAWVLNEAKGLPGGWGGALLVDREGSLWVGSEGLHRIKGRFLWTNFGPHQGLPSPNVWDIGRSQDGRIFACTDHGVAELHGEAWTPLPGTRDRTFFAGGGDAKDSLWFGGSGKTEATNTVFRLDLKSDRVEKVPLLPVKTGNLVLAITSDAGGGIYLGTLTGGVFHVHRNGAGWATDPMPFPGKAAEERVNALRKDASGRLWAATAHGLYVLDRGAWTRLGAREGLLGENCGGLARDPQGFVWVSFLDAKGINRVGPAGNGAWGALQTLTQPEALFRDTISSMTFDKAGVLWLGTGGGMKRWDGNNLEVYGRGDGLISQDPSANGIARDTDGSIWQGFSNGIAHFQPRAFTGVPAPPQARILEIQDARKPLPPEGPAPRVPYKDHTLTFQFGALSFLNEARIVNEVRLVGLENDWRETLIREARYPALPAGAYTFEVRSRFAEGQPGPVARYSFEILAPWWATFWFRALAVLGACAGVFLGLRRRTAQLSRRNAHLESLVAHRTEALNASKEDLERANRALEAASLVDPLTGLHNRRFLDLSLPSDAQQAQRAFRQLLDAGEDPLEAREDVVLFLMDLDYFKAVNDSHGHLAGDEVLRQLAGVLRSSTRATDSLIRWGGEEFLLVARRTRRADAPSVANGLLEAIRAYAIRLPGGIELFKTWSIGFCALPIHPRNPELGGWELALKLADQCLYAAKSTGRDRWVGTLMPSDADPAPLAGLTTWDVRWAEEHGLMDVISSDPLFRWPE